MEIRLSTVCIILHYHNHYGCWCHYVKPKTPPRCLQDASKTLPRRPKIPPRCLQHGSKLPKTSSNDSRTPKDASKTPPDLDVVPLSLISWKCLPMKLLIFGSVEYHFYMRLLTRLHVMSYQNMQIDYSVTLLLCCWRGGGVAALLRFGYLIILYLNILTKNI